MSSGALCHSVAVDHTVCRLLLLLLLFEIFGMMTHAILPLVVDTTSRLPVQRVNPSFQST